MTASNEFGGGSQNYTMSFGGSDTPAKAPPVRDVTTASFANDVIKASRERTILVDFWAPWCGPCKQLAPVLEKVVGEAGAGVALVKMNIDDHPSIAGQLGIQSIPAVIAFRNGQPVDGFMGALPESQIRDFVRKVGGGGGAADQIAEALAAATEARSAGDMQTAADIYSAVLERAPDNLDAIAALADLLFEAGETDQAKAILDQAPADKADAAALAAVRTKIRLAEEVAAVGDPAELERRLAANPNDHQARLDLAMIQNALGQREAAADSLLAIIKADRAWEDGAARARLLQLFEAWGMMDEATLSARRKLSSLLFS